MTLTVPEKECPVQQSMWEMPNASSPSWIGRGDPVFRDKVMGWAARPILSAGERSGLERSRSRWGGVLSSRVRGGDAVQPSTDPEGVALRVGVGGRDGGSDPRGGGGFGS